MLQRLSFLRHGIAVEAKGWPGEDRERPLTDKGRQLTRAVGERLAGLRFRADAILTSPAARALETASSCAECLDAVEILEVDSRLAPGFGWEAFLAILDDHRDADSLLFVGHEPDFSHVLAQLIGGGRLRLKKAGLAHLLVDSLEPPQATLLWLLPPKCWL